MPTTTPFNNLITFSRGSNATVTGSNGLIQWAPNNLLTFSEQFDNAAWVKFGAATVANTIAAPDGTFTADTLTENTSTGQHGVYQGATVVSGIVYTWSGYVRNNGRSIVQFQLQATANVYFVEFDLATETTTNRSGSGTASITNVGNGWYRITATATATGSGTGYWQLNLCSAANTASYTGDGVSGVRVWGAQLELGSTATTYNPTTVKNLLGFSEAFDNAAWGKTAATVVTGAQANPVNGLFNAQKLMEDTSTGIHIVQQSAGIVGNPQALSFYVKAAGRSWIRVQIGSIASAYFNVSTGATGTISNCTASITDVGSGWYRCAVLATRTANGNNIVYLASANGVDSYTGDGNSGVYIYGAQLSDSASLDPYVPTPGAAPSSTAFYGPRFDFDPVTLQPRGLLVEEQRTNLFTYSDQFNNANWAKVATSVTANAALSPNGTTDADLIIPDTTTGSKQVTQAATTTATTTTFSIYAKASGYNWIALGISDSGATLRITYFNLSTGVVGTVATGITASITPIGSGWYRCTVTVGTALAGSNTCRIYVTNADNVTSITGDGTSGVALYGAQLEAGAFATSYIPTVASTVTRSADVATITGQNFAQWYRQDENAFVVDASTLADNLSLPVVSVTDGSANNRAQLSANAANSLTVLVGGVVQASLNVGSIGVAGSRLAGAFKQNDFAASRNGGAAATDTSGTMPTVDRAGFGNIAGVGGNVLNGHIRSIRFIPARAADFQLQALTT